MSRSRGSKVWKLLGAFGLLVTMGVVAVPDSASVKVVSAAPINPTDPTKIPHYFGPYPNWANSPQTLADAVITISAPPVGPGNTTAEATATVLPKNATTGAVGSISSITVTSPGSGYATAPTVTITSPGVTPTVLATATATISQGAIASVDVVEPGFGYLKPTVAIGGATGTGAVAQASGGVDDLTITAGGSGYTINPVPHISLPDLPLNNGGRQAMAMATMNASGVVDSITVTDPGAGYFTAPTVDIWDGGAVNASGAATIKSTINVGRIDVTTGGSSYSAPTVTITDGTLNTVVGTGSGATAAATVAVAGAVTSITVTNAGAGYLTPGLQKFVDTLAGLGPNNKNNLNQYIPVAVPDTTTYPGTDYYEIGLVQYRQKFASSLPPTLLRGYVQLSTAIVPGAHVQLTNANVNTGVPDTIITGVFGVDSPHYLGPTILAQKDRPVRVLFRNLLPTGSDGNLFLPVDTSLMGSGMGPNMVQLDANKVPLDSTADMGTVTDGVRNPECGSVPKPSTCYAENRATLHLHGGITPWISDGTPHQWTTPAGEATDYPKGVSVSNVPDMPDPGPGAETFFYTNQQSARLMFYHDHAWGITRLNVYAGEAAGYVITDPMEQSLLATGGALEGLGTGTPLMIQDKTFVPSVAKMGMLDPTWNYARWGGEGNLWTPHVYMPAQNPGDPSGMSAFGRWMYGPWFWPPAKDAKYPPIANPYYDPTCDPNVVLPDGSNQFCEPQQIPSTPNVSVGMEAFNDTPIVNGTAYPTTTVAPQTYRYRILNASNDRFWNLSWYVADPRTGTLSEVALKQTELDAAQTDPVVFPTPDTAWSPKGPNWIQIGSEGGFLPTPVVVPAHETTWITDPTRFDVGNVDQHSLLLAPAERADVIVDFSQFRGRTLILYNDAPAAFPARVPGYDYYTGGPDLTPSGAPTTLPGYGPNTRTVMQVKVSATTAAPAFDKPGTTVDRMGALMTAFAHHLDGTGQPAGVFEKGSAPIIVGQAAYNAAYKATNDPTQFVASGWCNSPTAPSAKCDGYARIQEQGAVPGAPDTFKFKFDTLNGTQLSIPFEPKGMHDEMNSANFDEWGRMTANLGLEAPGATPLLQNIILYPYVNPATEILDSTTGMPSSLNVTPIATATDGTQIWKITHNGVDTHPIHFHLYDVQILNRVTWDNIIIPPEPTELGWKETVRVSPLEDTIVALRPIVPTLPFGVPDSKRPLNPAMPVGSRGDLNTAGLEAGFNNTNVDGSPMTTSIINAITNFGWEYVFHCHILSHEEMDMMRPVTVNVARALPTPPVLVVNKTSTVALTWTDGTPVNYLTPSTWTNPGTAEVGYKIERASGANGAFVVIGNALANGTSFTDNPNLAQTWRYRVTAWNAAGDSRSNVITVAPTVVLRATTTTVTSSRNPSTFGQSLTFSATVRPTTGTGTPTGTVQFSIDGVPAAGGVRTLNGSGVATFATSNLTTANHSVVATYGGDSVFATSASTTLTQVVGKASSTTTVTSSLNPSRSGNSVTFTVRATPVGNAGTIQLRIDGANFGAPLALDATGRATVTTSALAVGTHPVLAVYSGSTNYNTSTSTTLNQVVNP